MEGANFGTIWKKNDQNLATAVQISTQAFFAKIIKAI
jgi:hypothetical protein